MKQLLIISVLAITLSACASTGVPRSQSEFGGESAGNPMNKYDSAYYGQRVRRTRR